MRDFWRLLRSWLSGTYRKFPWRSLFVLLLVGIYAINPFDILPDFIPFFGVLDDAAMLGFLIRSLMKDVEKFKEWEAQHDKETAHGSHVSRTVPEKADATRESARKKNSGRTID